MDGGTIREPTSPSLSQPHDLGASRFARLYPHLCRSISSLVLLR